MSAYEKSILDAQGKVNLGKLHPISYDSSTRSYRILGDIVGNAFKDGTQVH